MTSTKYRVLFWFFSIFLAFSLFVLSIVFVLASPTHNIGSQIGVNYEAPVGVNLNFVNNTGSDVISDAYEIRYNEDITQFYIEGIVPSSATYQDGRIINDKGQEFYYFSNVPQDMEGNVIGNAGEGSAAASTQQSSENVTLSEGVSTLENSFVNIPENKNILAKRYYPSSSTDPIWYDLPEADIELYSTFLTPNCTNGTKATIGTNTDIVISHQVTSIPNDAFQGSSSTPRVVTSVVIPNGITSIGSDAFSYNYALSNVILPSTLTTINTYAFYCCDLTNITVPQKVNSIRSYAFHYNHKLIEVNNLSSLNIYATTSNSNGYIGYYAEEVFNSINYESKLRLFNEDFIMYENLEEPSIYLMGYIGESANVVLPTTSYDYDIYEYAFYYNNIITSVTIPSSVTSIGRSAFSDCSSLTSITIPDSVTSIGEYAFDYCSSLTSITIPDSVTRIESKAFRYCDSLTSITIPDSVTSIEESTFEGCSSLTSITIPDSVTSIGEYAFDDCSSLTSITIPDSVTRIESLAFFGCSNIQKLYIDDLISYLKSLIVSGSSSPLYGTFQAVSLYVGGKLITDLEISSEVTTIPDYAFKSLNITSVTIPSSVTSIGENAFYNCSNIQKLYIDDLISYLKSLIVWSSSPLRSTDKSVSLYVGGEPITNLEIPSEITAIPNYAFRSLNITSVIIPSGVTSIGDDAFSSCSSLTSITIPDSVTSIGGSAFSDCSSLETVNFGEKSQLTSIGDSAFYYCSSLTSITIPDSVTSIEKSAFELCINLTSIIIPDSVTIIEYAAFRYCYDLTIYCEASSKPSGWSSNWNYSNRPEYWAGEWEYDPETNEPGPIR